MIDSIRTALSGLLSAGTKAATAAGNIANANTTGAADGGASGRKAPYTPVDAVNTSAAGGGVQANVVPRQPAFVPAYDPSSPFANADGIIGAPNVSYEQEIVSLKQAELSYKANLKVIETATDMQDALIDAFDEKV